MAKRMLDLLAPNDWILAKVSTTILLERLTALAAVLTTAGVPAVGEPA